MARGVGSSDRVAAPEGERVRPPYQKEGYALLIGGLALVVLGILVAAKVLMKSELGDHSAVVGCGTLVAGLVAMGVGSYFRGDYEDKSTTYRMGHTYMNPQMR